MSDLNSLTNKLFDRREAMRPTARTWIKHGLLLLAAFFTVTVAGSLEPFGALPIFPDAPDPQNFSEFLGFLAAFPAHYLHLIVETVRTLATDFGVLKDGLKFSASLLAILTAHEAGHYVACRLHKVDATLPYFIPLPPLLGPAGTLGAFIKIVSPLPSRRATFDIGVAGPIAGFLALLPIAAIGILTMENVAPTASAETGLYFSEPLLLQFLASIFGVNTAFGTFNSFLAAAWVGLLITSLNLIPSGQLDGGHAVHAIFGERVHRWTGRIAFVAMLTISILGWIFYNSPSGVLFTVLLAVMLKVRHPEPLDEAPLNRPRIVVAAFTLLVFVLCFAPFPVQIK